MENKLSLGIDELDLDVRTFTALKRAGVNTIADIETRAEQLAETIPARQWKHITDALNTYKGIPMPGSLVEENILGDELTFDEIAEMAGEIIILDRSTESRNWYKAVKVEDVFVSNDGHRHLRYFDGAKQRGIIDEMYFDKSQRSPQRAWRVKLQDKPAELPTVQPERAAEVAEKFNYAALTAELGDYLRHKEEQLRNEYMNFTANCGRIFAEAQEKLSGSNQYNGLFEKWFTAMGFAKKTVYRMISVYNFRSCQIDTSEGQEFFDALPKTLQADISAPSAPPELVEQVMNGDITTHKEYIELKKQLEETKENLEMSKDDAQKAEERAEYAENISSKLSVKNSELEQRVKELENRPVDVAVDVDELNRRVSEAANKMNSEMEHTLAAERRDFADTLNAKDDRIWELEDEVKKLKSSSVSAPTAKILAFQMSMEQYKKLLEIVSGSDNSELYKVIQSVKIFS